VVAVSLGNVFIIKINKNSNEICHCVYFSLMQCIEQKIFETMSSV
jgi:hypothetical protein